MHKLKNIMNNTPDDLNPNREIVRNIIEGDLEIDYKTKSKQGRISSPTWMKYLSAKMTRIIIMQHSGKFFAT
jgi:hypothetical protein